MTSKHLEDITKVCPTCNLGIIDHRTLDLIHERYDTIYDECAGYRHKVHVQGLIIEVLGGACICLGAGVVASITYILAYCGGH